MARIIAALRSGRAYADRARAAKSRCVPAGRKPSVSRSSFEISAGWTFGNRKALMPCALSRESSCVQTGSTVLDERAERHNLGRPGVAAAYRT